MDGGRDAQRPSGPQQALTVQVAAGALTLLADRAAYLPTEGLLLVADAHLGKAQSFRRLGVPVPAGTTERNLQRLSRLIAETRPRELVFLGDLLHARRARSASMLATVAAWRAQHRDLPMRLVRGNHDDRAGDPPDAWGVTAVDEPYRVGDWALCHEPLPVAAAYRLAGHVHPGHILGRGAERLRLPCFHLCGQGAVLPAFGEFTGLSPVRPAPGDRLVLIADGQLRLIQT